MVNIPSNLKPILVEIVISDAWLQINKAGNTRLAFKQSIDNLNEALAYWICCDGTRTYNGITLQTQSFTIKEVAFIVNVLFICKEANLPFIFHLNLWKKFKLIFYLTFVIL
jgi:hypothetical protein